MPKESEVEPLVFFSDHFRVDEGELEKYGAFNISLVTDLPLFIDPFLLFHSEKDSYKNLHREIIRYLCFLRDNVSKAEHSKGLKQEWFYFKEVKQTWLGFSQSGNSGRGLKEDFAIALLDGFKSLLADFGKESITESAHLEKLCLNMALFPDSPPAPLVSGTSAERHGGSSPLERTFSHP